MTGLRDRHLYFAYGSNLDSGQLKGRCPSASFRSVAKLPDHAFVISRRSKKWRGGVANIVPRKGRDVWGIVFSLSDPDIKELDRAEGYKGPGKANAYEPREVELLSEQKSPLRAFTYFAIPEESPPPPSQAYADQVLKAAQFWKLPTSYLSELKSALIPEESGAGQ